MEYTKGEWKAGYNPGVTGPTTPAITPVCGGKDWPYRTVNIGTETIAICPAQDTERNHNPNVKEAEANAHLIVTAVNACQSVNRDNPLAVAESIEDLYEALKVAHRELLHAQWEDGLDQIEQALARVEGK